jgi:dUTP pyrophosphatase
MQIPIKRLDPSLPLPLYAHESDAGFDLMCAAAVTIAPRERVQVKTGIALAIPDGYSGLIWDKSGLSHKAGLKTLGGVVDSGYRGEILVGVANLSNEPYSFAKGDKVAQMLIQKIEQAQFKEVDELPESERGAKGFGSTGK